MHAKIGRGRLTANILASVLIVTPAIWGIGRVASRHWRLTRVFHARAEFARIDGLQAGDEVRVQGMKAGVVESINPPESPGRPVSLIFRIDDRLRSLVRIDARARIAAQGIVGAKVVEIEPGRPDAAGLEDWGLIRSEPTVEVASILRDASLALKRVDAVADSAQKGLEEIGAIATSIRKGEGSLGRFVHDDQAYSKLLDLTRQGQKTLVDLEENLAALKRTWPISSYFKDRAFFDRDRVLFKPGSERDEKTLPADELFERGKAILTNQGRGVLDGVAKWFRKQAKPSSEVVIAAFTAAGEDEELNLILTQEQAEAVRKYMVDYYSIDSIGWFSSRRVAAVGFGSRAPKSIERKPETKDEAPPRRVEFIVFTPRK